MVTVFVVLVIALWKFLTYPFEPLARFIASAVIPLALAMGI